MHLIAYYADPPGTKYYSRCADRLRKACHMFHLDYSILPLATGTWERNVARKPGLHRRLPRGARKAGAVRRRRYSSPSGAEGASRGGRLDRSCQELLQSSVSNGRLGTLSPAGCGGQGTSTPLGPLACGLAPPQTSVRRSLAVELRHRRFARSFVQELPKSLFGRDKSCAIDAGIATHTAKKTALRRLNLCDGKIDSLRDVLAECRETFA